MANETQGLGPLAVLVSTSEISIGNDANFAILTLFSPVPTSEGFRQVPAFRASMALGDLLAVRDAINGLDSHLKALQASATTRN